MWEPLANGLDCPQARVYCFQGPRAVERGLRSLLNKEGRNLGYVHDMTYCAAATVEVRIRYGSAHIMITRIEHNLYPFGESGYASRGSLT